MRQTPVQDLCMLFGNGLQQGQRHLRANHGSRLQEALVLWR